MRRDVDEKIPGEGIKVVSHDIKQGVLLDDLGVKVTAFLVDHGPVTPAFGYRVDYRGHSVVLSGDTRGSENLIQFAKSVDSTASDAERLSMRVEPSRSRLPSAVQLAQDRGR
jgi:ribonuclease Z